MVGAEAAQLALAGVDLLVERVDQGEAGRRCRLPGLGQGEPLEQPPAAGAEEVAARVGDAVGDQDRVDAVLEGGPVPDQVEAEAGALALGPDRRVGQPDLGDEVAASEFGQDPGVDLVRLAGQWRQPFGLERIGDPHVPARELEPIVHEARAVHRLDHREHLRIAQSPNKPGQPVGVGRHRPTLEQP